jgi:putative spermidine/putrescine transport system substrate-binding protein
MIPSTPLLRRRQLLRLGLGASALLALPAGLAGCRQGRAEELLLVGGELPAAWLGRLPSAWRSRSLDTAAAVLEQLQNAPQPPALADLVSLGDGWATSLPASSWQPLQAPALLDRLADWARPISRLFGPPEAPALAFPWAFSPWVLVLRSRPSLAARGEEGWDLLLDPSLTGKLVLPSSPRLAIELMGRDFDRIQALRRQPLAYDDRDGLSLLLNGEAEAAVVPLRRLIPLLRRDPRLQVVLPASGAPLSWQLLLRPAGATAPLPVDWITAALEPPLLSSLLQAGWVPPLPRPLLEQGVRRFPEPLASLLLPDQEVLERCWSLPPLTVPQRLALQTVWDASGLPD